MIVKNKIAVFSCGDENYVPHMCAALAIACKYNDNLKPYILSDVQDEKMLNLIGKFNITLLQTDLSETFQVHNSNWPNHMFWYFIVPETLYDMGYDYSMFIDADVYCRKELDLSWLNDSIEIAARSDKDNEYNSGVIFFNNRKMKEKALFQTTLSVYNSFSTDEYFSWHGGLVHDQQVLTGLCEGNQFNDFWGGENSFNVLDLNVIWNYPFQHLSGKNDNFINMDVDELEEKLNCIHFLLSRPWLPYEKWGGQHGMFKTKDFPNGWVVKTREGEPKPESRIYFVNKWREEVRQLEIDYDIKLFDDFDELKGY